MGDLSGDPSHSLIFMKLDKPVSDNNLSGYY